MFPPRKILFPVDFSARCTIAAKMVETLAGRFRARVTMLHVVEPIMYTDLPVDASSIAQEQLDNFLSDRFTSCDVERVLLHGDASHKIVDFAHDGRFNLIMLPTHGYGRFRRFILGSVAAKVLHDARCPVWTGAHMEHIPSNDEIRFRNVVCAIDLGKQSCQALRWAGLFAQEFGAHLTIVHAVPTAKDHPNIYCDQDWKSELVRGAKEKIQTLQRSLALDATISVIPDEIPFAVSTTALHNNAELLVIGRSVEDGMLGRLRTNAYSIIRQSPCPVVSV
jgi:nucleotide-binding universal stress UspA family protein